MNSSENRGSQPKTGSLPKDMGSVLHNDWPLQENTNELGDLDNELTSPSVQVVTDDIINPMDAAL